MEVLAFLIHFKDNAFTQKWSCLFSQQKSVFRENMISPFVSPVTRESSDMSTENDGHEEELNEAIKKAHDIARKIQEEKEKNEIWSFWESKVCPRCSNQLFSLIIWSDRTQYECESCKWKCTIAAVDCDKNATSIK